MQSRTPQGRMEIWQIVGIFALIAVIAGILIFFRYRNNSSSSTNNSNTTNQATQLNINALLSNTSVTQLPPDDDTDGLSNTEEQTAGTNPKKADSDSDGLTDSDEVRVYKSDPLKSDTDGDGNTDGTEVKNGYSPTDGTKLLDLEREKQKFTQ